MKQILHHEKLSALTLNVAEDKESTPAGFESQLGSSGLAKAFYLSLKAKAVFNALPTAGELIIQVLAGATVIHSESFGAGAAIQAKSNPVDTTNISAGTVLTVKAVCSTVFTGAVSAEIDCQLVTELPAVIGNCG